MRIIIIGGVAAGMSAAAKAKRTAKDAEVVIYESTDVVSWGACGLPYYVGDFFEDHRNMIARPVEKLIDTGLDIRLKHEVVSLNPERKTIKVKNLLSGTEFEDSFDRLMIATGARAVIPPIKNANLENVFTLKSLEDGLALKEYAKQESVREVVIIGAGFIGIETVEAMKKLGKNVRLIELNERVLSDAFDKEITEIMEVELVKHGVYLHLNEAVKEFKGKGKAYEVVTDKGSYKADLIIIAAGVKPNTTFLKETGINMLPNGALIIDEFGETSLKDVYSAGDCAVVYHAVRGENTYIPLATTANKIGRIVGENLAGKRRTSFSGTLGSAAVKVLDLEAGRTGISENEALKMGLQYKTVFIKDKNQTNYYPGQEDIHVKLIYNAESRILLGGQIIGKKGAVLRVDVLAAAVFMKMTVDQLGMLDLCYAPPFARTWDVLNVAGNAAK